MTAAFSKNINNITTAQYIWNSIFTLMGRERIGNWNTLVHYFNYDSLDYCAIRVSQVCKLFMGIFSSYTCIWKYFGPS